ncbi:Uncharacterised protein [uncultured archaeon]|nr:Uncharacterised protein [uncultured archaeon]
MRCNECGTVQSIQREREPLVTLKVIVNKDDISSPYLIKIPGREELCVGDELLVDDLSQDVVMTEIASLETDRRVDKAPAAAVKTVWARAIDEVPLKLSIYRGGRTHPLKVSLPGNEVLEVGEIREMEGFKFGIVKIKLRKEGFADAAEAKDILRVWGREL